MLAGYDKRRLAKARTMTNDILENTFSFLRDSCLGLRPKIVELHITRYFNTVELEDGSIGSCMNYCNLTEASLARVEADIRQYVGGDALSIHAPFHECELLKRCLAVEQRYLLLTSLLATVVSAMSARRIKAGGDEMFCVTQERPMPWVDGVEAALVIGFGGYLNELACSKDVRKLHVLDLHYEHRRQVIDDVLAELRQRFPGKSITIASREEGGGQLMQFDLVAITGSTLCNGTLEGILAKTRQDAVKILQGQSASIHPRFLFEAGVNWVATTIKPVDISRTARGDYKGDGLRPWLEGRLPWIYLVPRGKES
jgi:hypothetical protein